MSDVTSICDRFPCSAAYKFTEVASNHRHRAGIGGAMGMWSVDMVAEGSSGPWTLEVTFPDARNYVEPESAVEIASMLAKGALWVVQANAAERGVSSDSGDSGGDEPASHLALVPLPLNRVGEPRLADRLSRIGQAPLGMSLQVLTGDVDQVGCV